jgi:aryl sulfotransferase
VPAAPFRYQSPDEDSGRWDGFPFRDGDIVISTRSKTGTTWVQMICALLTHTPLDGIPLDPRATYLVTARHPLDMFVSLYHQGDNIDHQRLRELTGQPEPTGPPRPRTPLHDRLLRWIDEDDDPREHPDSLPGLMCHLSGAWARRGEPNVLLVHYDDLSADLEGQMRALAGRLGIAVPEPAWPALAAAASFSGMRARADRLVPTAGLFKSNAAFFRRGRSGAGRETLSEPELAAYYERAAALAPPDLLAWLHR